MKKSILAVMILLSGCTSGTGKFKGKIVDSSYEGIFFKTCEVDVQYGEQSSRVERFSSSSKTMCDSITALVGKPVEIQYDQTIAQCLFCSSSDMITSVKAE